MVNDGMSSEQREIAELKARLSALENNNRNKKQSNLNQDKVKSFFSKNKKLIVILSILTIIIVAIMTTCISFLGIRGVYVNENDPYESYSFSATTYEKRDKSYEGDIYVDKGSWSRSGDKLTISYKDEWFGKVKEEYNIVVSDNNNSLTIISGEDEDTFKRVSKVSWNLSKNKKINISFDLNGGTTTEEIKNIEVKFGESFEYELPIPSREGASFRGWYSTVDGFKNNGKVYADGKPVYEDVTYYANWFLHSDCLEHKYNSNCVCTICGKVEHTYNEECICTNCGLDTHTVLECGVCCSLCQQQIHPYDDFYQCQNCSYINADEVKKHFGLSLSLGGDWVAITGVSMSLTNVIIPNYVTRIGSYAFRDCSSLTSVTIPDSVTSIGDYAFKGCYKLVEVYNLSTLTITKGSSSNGYVGYYAKDVYTSLDTPSKLSTDSNGYIIYTNGDDKILVGYTGSATTLVLPDDITEIYKYAFYDCDSLTSVTIGNSVTSIGGYAFDGCPIEYASIPTIAISKIPKSKLKEVVITGGTIIGSNAFYYCDSLMSVTIPNSVTIIGDSAFYKCDSLTSVTIPNSVTSIGSYAFYSCDSLTSVNYTGTIDQWVQIKFAYKYANPARYANNLYINNELVTEANITTATSINAYAFDNCTSLTSVTIPNSVTSIGDDAFRDCSSLTSVNYTGTIDQWVQIEFDYKYANPTRYANNLYINNELVTEANITTATSINAYAFYNFSSLTSVTIGDSVTSIGYEAFYSCDSLTSVTIGDSVTSIGASAFYKCYSLTSVTIPNSVTSIGDSAFYSCDSLTSVTIPDSVTSIRRYVFYNCTSLTSVTIPNSVTSIGSYAFYNCDRLTSVTIGNSVTSIGSSAFYNCDRLMRITFEDTSTWYRTSSAYNWENKTDGTQTDVATPTSNDELFVDNYYNYYWYKL